MSPIVVSIRTILLPLRESPIAERMLDVALDAAERYQAHLDVLHVMPDPDEILPFATLGLSSGMRASVTEAARKASEETARALAALFQECCKRRGVAVEERAKSPGRASAYWTASTGRRDVIVGRAGRLADLVIVPRPRRVSPPPRTFEAALRDTGRPVLMVPGQSTGQLATDRVAIAWNGSKEAAQAVAAGMPWLREAKGVTVLCSKKRMQSRPNGEDVVSYLACHGVSARVRIFDAAGPPVGAELLTQTRDLGCGLLVCGAYSRGRLQELVTGGVTRHLLEHADIPVLMVH